MKKEKEKCNCEGGCKCHEGSECTCSDGCKCKEKIVELTNDLQRTRADFENYRKQIETQKVAASERAFGFLGIKGLDGIDDQDVAFGSLGLVQNAFERGFAQQQDVPADFQTVRPELQLGGTLLSGRVQHGAVCGHGVSCLHQ